MGDHHALEVVEQICAEVMATGEKVYVSVYDTALDLDILCTVGSMMYPLNYVVKEGLRRSVEILTFRSL